MTDERPLWLVGLRRHLVSGSALDRWIDERGVTGVLWTPGASPVDDWTAAAVALADAGAKADWSLLWDLVCQDARAACESLGHVYNSTDGRDGYAAVWIQPERLADPGRAASHASDLLSDVARGNFAVAFSWHPSRAGAVSAIVAEGIAVAVSGGAPDAVERARQRGMDKLREEEPDAVDVPVLLLGSQIELVREIGLLARGRGAPARQPTSADQERSAFEGVFARLRTRTRPPVWDDEHLPASFAAGAAAQCRTLDSRDAPERIWARDHTFWQEDPADVADRLGWLDAAESAADVLGDLASFARSVRSSGVDRVVLLGMGGSSVAPELFSRTFGGVLTVLDSTHPAHVAAVTASLDRERTVVVVSSKSGTTIETLSHLEHVWSAMPRGDRFVAVTDAGSPLAALAAERRFARVFEAPTDVGGRYSAATWFGLVPSALAGVDVGPILDRTVAMMASCGPSVVAGYNPGMRLAASLAHARASGHDKLTFVVPAAIAGFADWLEQLVAESTGKRGTGIVPVAGEDLGAPDSYGADRVFCAYAIGDEPFPEALDELAESNPVVRIRIPDTAALGAEIFRWELGVAALCALLDVNPFDQPDVEAAKVRARERLDRGGGPVDRGSASDVLDELAPPGYLALQAFLAPTDEHVARLRAARLRFRDALKVATTVGFGPRFLHSTGQLHKGGPAGGRFLQVVDDPDTDVDVPGRGYTFGKLIRAQADGDLLALREAGRSVARVTPAELERLG